MNHNPETIFALGDIHGHLEALDRALAIINLDLGSAAHLVLLGDYVDRGPHSRQVLERVSALKKEHPGRVVALLGNHDVEFLDWVFDDEDDDPSWLLADRGQETVRSFLHSSQLDELLNTAGADDRDALADLQGERLSSLNGKLKAAILEQHAALLKEFRRSPLLHEAGDHVFVHAGIDEQAGQLWKAATDSHTLTHKFPATTGSFHRTVIAGHVETSSLNPDRSHGIFHDGASHYFVDGSVETTQKLNIIQCNLTQGTYTFHNQI